MKLNSTQPTPLLGRGWGRLLPSPPWEGLGEAPDTPVQKGIERFIEWYKPYFKLETLNSEL
jgi:hypothetical protein